MSATTQNGSTTAEETKEDRVVFGEAATLTIEPFGKTLGRRDTGIKWPAGDKVVLLVGELDGVRCYVHERDGHTHVWLTRREMRP